MARFICDIDIKTGIKCGGYNSSTMCVIEK